MPARARQEGNSYLLRLYIAGLSPRSSAAVDLLTAVCEEYVSGRYHIDLVDLLRDPRQARADRVFAVPTVVRRTPTPVRRLIGEMSNRSAMARALELGARKGSRR